MTTIHDVARHAGVASITASRALSGNAPVSAAVRERVERAVQELGYVPNALAQSLKSRFTGTIGLVVSDITNPFFTSLTRGVEDVAQAAGYSVIVGNTDESLSKQRTYLEMLRRKRVDGLLLVPAGGDPADVSDWLATGTPLALVCRTVQGIDLPAAHVDVVRGESLRSSERLVSHLVAHGHTRIAIVDGPLDLSTAAERFQGYRAALRRAGFAPDPELERFGPFTVEAGSAATHSLLDLPVPPTAYFAANNFLSVGVLRVLRERGIRVPEDVALVGFDDIPQMAYLDPFVTVAAQPAAQIGRKAAAALLARIDAQRTAEQAPGAPGEETIFETDLLLRRSCGCPPSGATAYASPRAEAERAPALV